MIVKTFSNIGKKSRQEDSIAISSDQRLFVLCDGVGGLENGHVASDIVCKAVIAAYEKWKGKFKHRELSRLVLEAQKELNNAAVDNAEYQNMSTTYILVYINRNKVSVSHMGDSKAFLMSPYSGLKWESRDDSVVQELYEDGIINGADEILTHPLRNRITKMLQAKTTSYLPDQNIATKLRLPKDFIVLVGSDGAFENYTSQQIVNHFSNKDITLESRWELFKDFCNTNSIDNNSAILIIEDSFS